VKDGPLDDNDVVAQVLGFVGAGSERLEMPVELSGRQRKMVHDLLDKLGPIAVGIHHESQGVGRRRCLVLWRAGGGTNTPSSPSITEKASSSFTSAHSSGSGSSSEEELEEKYTGGEDVKVSATPTPDIIPSPAPPSQPLPPPPAGGHQLGGNVKSGETKILSKNPLMASLAADRLSRRGATPPPPPPLSSSKANTFTEGGDDMDLIEQAIQMNQNMTEMINPPSEAMKAHYYQWGKNPVQKKDLRQKLEGKIAAEASKRKSSSRGEGKGKGGGGNRGRGK